MCIVYAGPWQSARAHAFAQGITGGELYVVIVRSARLQVRGLLQQFHLIVWGGLALLALFPLALFCVQAGLLFFGVTLMVQFQQPGQHLAPGPFQRV